MPKFRELLGSENVLTMQLQLYNFSPGSEYGTREKGLWYPVPECKYWLNINH